MVLDCYCVPVLCSLVPSTQLSHTTLQFIRYSTLLHNVKKLKDGHTSDHILRSIFSVLAAITEAPELRMEFLQSSLGSLLVDTNARLIRGGVDKYWRKLVSFIETVLQYYGIAPVSGGSVMARVGQVLLAVVDGWGW